MAKVNHNGPCALVYALSENPMLGFIIEPYVVQISPTGDYTLTYQKVYVATINDFRKVITSEDEFLIRTLEQCSMESLAKKYYKGTINPKVFFETKVNEQLLQIISEYVAKITRTALTYLSRYKLFLKAKDGYPAHQLLKFAETDATVVFHFIRGKDSMRYYPTIKHDGKKIEFIFKNAKVISEFPAHLLIGNIIYKFEDHVDGKKIRAFLEKRYIEVPKASEETYFRKFVAPLIEQYHVHAEGFEIIKENYQAVPILKIESIWNGSLQLMLYFKYGEYIFPFKSGKKVSVSLEQNGDNYVFHRVKRSIDWEQHKTEHLLKMGLVNVDGAGFNLDIYATEEEDNMLQHEEVVTVLKPVNKYGLIEWLSIKSEELKQKGFEIDQSAEGEKYLIASSNINITIKENNDWFDVDAVVQFGDHTLPFKALKKHILQGIREFRLPDGKIAIIPEQWFAQYRELLSLSSDDSDGIKLKKHHVGYIKELQEDNLAEVSINRKLAQLFNFEGIEQTNMPVGFKGSLRPYQKAGYDWLSFLDTYKFGGCLADDMGLGKTIQTLAFLQQQKELISNNPIPVGQEAYHPIQIKTSLLVMPTSLIYNWLSEAEKFTPELKVLVYTGAHRIKNAETFSQYDLVITTYGLIRIDTEVFYDFYFNYIILDESQSIKNFSSLVTKAVLGLRSKNKLVLSGTPIENSVSELWTQLSFTNEGLLGSYSKFKDEFVTPIEKDKNPERVKKLHALIKPFILRRTKEQVATDLPPKVEQLVYCDMTESQESYYEKIKSEYRNELLKSAESLGGQASAISILTGLTKLRQIANHPKMVEKEYEGDSGKFEEVIRMLESAVSENHKILIFSQFVKQLEIFRSYLEENNINFLYLDGGTNSAKRKDLVDEFQNNEDKKVFLISLKAGGVGLNLTAADYVFILDPWWNPAIEQQAVDRSHRIGQKKTVFTYKFISKNSVEEKIVKLQERKRALSNSLITTEESFMKSLTPEDLKSIFE